MSLIVLTEPELATLRAAERHGELHRYSDGFRVSAPKLPAFPLQAVYHLEQRRALKWSDGTGAAVITEVGRELVRRANKPAKA